MCFCWVVGGWSWAVLLVRICDSVRVRLLCRVVKLWSVAVLGWLISIQL